MNRKGKSILLLGGGGHCKSVLCALLSTAEYDRIGIVETTPGGELLGVPVVGTDDDLPQLAQVYSAAFITVGSLGDIRRRKRLWSLACKIGFTFPNIIDISATVSPFAALGRGIFVGKRAVVNAGAAIGDCAILNTGCIVEHDDDVGAFSHIAPGAVLGGNVRIEEDTHVGSHGVVLQGVTIGPGCIVGAGSVVTKSLPGYIVAYGNPCKEVRKHAD